MTPCICPRNASGSLDTPRAHHLEKCPHRGRKSGRSGSSGKAVNPSPRARIPKPTLERARALAGLDPNATPAEVLEALSAAYERLAIPAARGDGVGPSTF